MINHLLKQFGFATLGFCILASAASLELRLESIEKQLSLANASTIALGKYAEALPMRALQ